MKRSILLFLCVAALFSACKRDSSLHELDLIQRLPYGERFSDTHAIIFGTPEGKRAQISGWGNFEKNGTESYQWAVSPSASLFFNINRRQRLFLHLKIGSFFVNHAQVLVNKKPVATIVVPMEPDTVAIPVPPEVLNERTNVVEFVFAELRRPDSENDPRSLAAAVYSAVITPANYLESQIQNNTTTWMGAPESLVLQNKKRQAYTFPAGGALRYYEKVNRNSVLQFGAYYKASPLSEDDDFAEFTITLRNDRGVSREIYKKRSQTSIADFQKIKFADYMNSEQPEIYELEFRIRRNSISNSGKAAWIEPALYVNSAERPVSIAEQKRMENLRKTSNRANVILIILDAAGAKHVSSYGYFRKTTPNIDGLAQQGIRFNRAYCQAVYTLASTASLMSGLDPFNHRIILRRSRLPQETVTLAERFLNGGYDTGTFVANGNASSIFGMTQGFQEAGEVFREPNYSGWGKDITNRFTGWLGKGRSKPFFAYLHYREPHAPFNPPEQFKNRFTDPNYAGLKDASYERRKQINMGQGGENQAEREYITATYDENLLYGDHEVGRVIARLKELGIYEETILIVTADHGEAFWEHGFQGHNSQLYEESVRIPLVLKLTKDSQIEKKTIENKVGTIDIYPTLVDLTSLSRRALKVDGKSFVPYLVSDSQIERPVMSQIIEERGYAYIDDGFKYIIHLASRNEELFNLEEDAAEQHNLVKEHPVRASYLRSRIFGWMASSKRIGAFQKAEKATIDETTRENLKALGYVD